MTARRYITMWGALVTIFVIVPALLVWRCSAPECRAQGQDQATGVDRAAGEGVAAASAPRAPHAHDALSGSR